MIGDSGEHFAAPGSFGQIVGAPRPGVLDVEFEPGTRDVDGNPHVHLQQWVPAWDVEPAGPRAVQDPA